MSTRVDIPLDIVYAVIDDLVLPTHRFAYAFDPLILKTLRAFLFVSKETHRFASHVLYSRVTVTSIAKLGQLCQASASDLRMIRALCLDLDNIDEELIQYATPNFHPPQLKRPYDSLSTSLCYIVRSTQGNLQRLAILTPSSVHLRMHAIQHGLWPLDTLTTYWTEIRQRLAEALSESRPKLVELALVGHRYFRDYFPKHQNEDWCKLRRLTCSHAALLLEESAPSMPALECICADGVREHEIESLWLAVPSLRKAILFYDYGHGRSAMQQRAGSRQPPIDLLFINVHDEEHGGLVERPTSIGNVELGLLVQSGLLWENTSGG